MFASSSSPLSLCLSFPGFRSLAQQDLFMLSLAVVHLGRNVLLPPTYLLES